MKYNDQNQQDPLKSAINGKLEIYVNTVLQCQKFKSF